MVEVCDFCLGIKYQNVCVILRTIIDKNGETVLVCNQCQDIMDKICEVV